MKHKISITVDEEVVLDILQAVRTGKFRNKSHVVEYAVKKLLESNGKKLDLENEKLVIERGDME